jgi:predicted exporter
LSAARDAGIVRQFLLPAPLAPSPRAQRENRSTIQWFVDNEPRLSKVLLDAGFTSEALGLYQQVVKVWRPLLVSNDWPTTVASHPAAETLSSFVSDSKLPIRNPQSAIRNPDDSQSVLLGTVTLPGKPATPHLPDLMELRRRIIAAPETGLQLAAWEALGPALSTSVQRDFLRQTLPLLLVLCAMLVIVFRDIRDFALVLALLIFGAAMLIAAMTLIRHPWNLTSLAALPLHLGTGIDYGIYILQAMRRENNNIPRVLATTGRAVLFCGLANIIGFSSLLLANNRGIFSLGLACSIGLVNILILSLCLLPHWRILLRGRHRLATATAVQD